MKKVIVPLVLVALAAVLAAGCGGGGSSKNKAYANSVSQYASAIDQICGSVNTKLKAMHTNTLAGLAANGPKAKSIISDGLNKIDNLQPPDQVKSAADDFVSKGKQAVGMYDSIISAAKNKDTAKIQQIGSKIAALDKSTHQDATTIGALKCAQNG